MIALMIGLLKFSCFLILFYFSHDLLMGILHPKLNFMFFIVIIQNLHTTPRNISIAICQWISKHVSIYTIMAKEVVTWIFFFLHFHYLQEDRWFTGLFVLSSALIVTVILSTAGKWLTNHSSDLKGFNHQLFRYHLKGSYVLKDDF